MKSLFTKKILSFRALIYVSLLVSPFSLKADPTVVGPYTLKVFATAPNGVTKPDSITIDPKNHIWVTYTNGVAPDGTDGKASTVVEYSHDGEVLHTYSILGSNDGLKYNPYDHKIWAMRNEDGNGALTIIDPETHIKTDYTFNSPAPHGGGYDDLVFRNGKVYVSASNPTLNASGMNLAPSIVKIKLVGSTVETEPVLMGNAYAINAVTGAPVQTVQTDPDSFTTDTFGNLVLDSQADSILLFVSNPGTYAQNVLELPLTDSTGAPVQVDDTDFATNPEGTIYFADAGANTVYALSSKSFLPGSKFGYTSTGPSIGTIDLHTGVYTPVVSGLVSSHGALYVPEHDHDGDDKDHNRSFDKGDDHDRD